MDAYYFTYNQIHKIIGKAAQEIIRSGFMPDLILAVGGGGFIPARILRSFIKRPIVAVAISYYNEADQLTDEPMKHQWLDGIDLKNKKILLVDEIDDSRTTLEYCLTELFTYHPAEVAVFVVHNKRKEKKGHLPEGIKHFFVGQELDDKWVKYPWDVENIDEHDRNTYD